MWPFTGIKSKLLLAFAGSLIVTTLLNAGLASYLTDRQSEIDASDLLSQQLTRLQTELQRARDGQVVVAEEAASDDKNLSDMATLSSQEHREHERRKCSGSRWISSFTCCCPAYGFGRGRRRVPGISQTSSVGYNLCAPLL